MAIREMEHIVNIEISCNLAMAVVGNATARNSHGLLSYWVPTDSCHEEQTRNKHGRF